MSTGVIIATHGLSSIELLKSAEMIVGNQENVETITFKEGQGLEELNSAYQDALSRISECKDILIFVDILGGSPFNVGALLNYPIIAGVNIPMLLELFMKRDTVNVDELIDVVLQAGKESIVQFTQADSIEEDEEF